MVRGGIVYSCYLIMSQVWFDSHVNFLPLSMNKCKIHLYICLTHSQVAIFFFVIVKHLLIMASTFQRTSLFILNRRLWFGRSPAIFWWLLSYFPCLCLLPFFLRCLWYTLLLQAFFANLYLLINQQMITNGYELKVRQIRVFITGNKTPTLVDEEK